MVLYRKYRPQKFSEVIGQEHITRTLQNAIRMGKIAHAYLFTGPRGSGKTTVARILAKVVNCEKNKDSEPCNECSACKEITSGRALDLIEIDAASHTGVDNIREVVVDGTRFSPTQLKFKVYIIDESHMLSKGAFNALLKTLEEPPAHAIFVLATTEPHKIPQTILSRCQRFDFRKLNLPQMAELLSRIAQEEKVNVDKQALQLIALNADGDMRDAETLLEQIISLEDKKITLKEVQRILGTTDILAVIKLVDFLVDKKTKEGLSYINKLANKGYDLEQFSKSLIDYLRKLLIIKIDPELHKLAAPELTPEQLAKIKQQGAKFETKNLTNLLRLFIQASWEIKGALFPQLPLELAIVESIGE